MENPTVSKTFELQAARVPNRVALRAYGDALRFSELNELANQWARRLQGAQVGVEDTVGISLGTSIPAIVAILATLKAGAAYVVLDPALPKTRLEAIARQSRLSVIITDSTHKPSWWPPAATLDWKEAGRSVQNESTADLHVGTGRDNLAYISYTSGSTKTPRGVLATHRSILNGLAAVPFDPDRTDEVCALNSPLSFGFSISRVFLPLLCGVTLVVLNDDDSRDADRLTAVFETEGVTSAALVTSFIREIVHSHAALIPRLHRLRTLTVGGSVLANDLRRTLHSLFPGVTLIDGYGASEIGGAAMTWQSTPGPGDVAHGGRPFPNTHLYILDQAGLPAAPGSEGELYIGAPHLSRGYLGDPVETSARFVPDPFGDQPGGRLFRTGDLCRQLPTGEYEILGRADDEIKIRGFRVGLGTVEHALQTHPAIQQAVVKGQRGEDGENHLAAYAVVRGPVSVGELRRHLAATLPDYMIPATFTTLDRLPTTPTGKIDRLALPEPQPNRPALEVCYVAPRDGLESALVEIWTEVLGLDRIGIYDNFFELGGHSLLALRIMHRVQQLLGLDLPPAIILRSPTIAELSALLRGVEDSN